MSVCVCVCVRGGGKVCVCVGGGGAGGGGVNELGDWLVGVGFFFSGFLFRSAPDQHQELCYLARWARLLLFIYFSGLQMCFMHA
mgnify:CR=1 FL=1